MVLKLNLIRNKCAVQFGSDGTAAAPQLGISVEEARKLVSNLLENMKGLGEFKIKSSKKVREEGYVVGNAQTGHKAYWWDHDEWKRKHLTFNSSFWEDYKKNRNNPDNSMAREIREHFKAASKWDRMALNIPTQMGGAVVLKTAIIYLWNWVLENNLFGKVLFVNFTHDEINCEFPKELTEFPKKVAYFMEKAGADYYKELPLPAEPAVGEYWIH